MRRESAAKTLMTCDTAEFLPHGHGIVVHAHVHGTVVHRHEATAANTSIGGPDNQSTCHRSYWESECLV